MGTDKVRKTIELVGGPMDGTVVTDDGAAGWVVPALANPSVSWKEEQEPNERPRLIYHLCVRNGNKMIYERTKERK